MLILSRCRGQLHRYFEFHTLSDFLCPHISTDDAIGRTCKDEYELAMRSLGAVVWYLQFCYLDHDVLSLRSFSEYTPLDGSTATTTDSKAAGEDGQLMSFQHSRMVSE